jgi:ketosteroid isomerase-like protein
VICISDDISVEDEIVAIRALRTQSNNAIARHDVGPALAILRDDVRVIASGGQLFDGATSMGHAFEQTFADPQFIRFVRRPETIDVNGTTAAEAGAWEGVWKSHTVHGKYLARWQRERAGWRVVSELYIPLESTAAE